MRVVPPLLLLSLLPLAGAALAAPFRQTLSLQGVTFAVDAVGEGSTQVLAIRAHLGIRPYPPVKQELTGQVIGAKVADLNRDGKPGLLVVVQSAGSGSYGSVEAWSAGPRKLEPIPLPELTGPLAQGYMGHDRFAVEETSLVRSFPLYRPGDSNGRATGGTREIVYQLTPTPAGWTFSPTRSADLPPP